MKKVGIITLTKNANYGNVLQNIAMQKIVSELGFEAETILNLTNSTLFNKKFFSFANLVKWMLNYNGYRENEKRNENFRKCCSKNLQYSDVTYNNGRFSKEPTGYEYSLREATRCGIQLLDLQQSLNFWALCRKIEKFRMLQVLELIILICCLSLERTI